MLDNPDYGRGTGRTTKQIQTAPHGAVFVWCNSFLDYPTSLAQKLNRTDLIIIRLSQFDEQYIHGRNFTGVIFDHACHLSERNWRTLEVARRRIKDNNG